MPHAQQDVVARLKWDAYVSFVGSRTLLLFQAAPHKDILHAGNGTGTFLSWGDRLFIITAGHVARAFPAKHKIVIPHMLDPKRPSPHITVEVLSSHIHQHRDVGLIEVPAHTCEMVGGIPISPKDIEATYYDAPGNALLWGGYPRELKFELSPRYILLYFSYEFTISVDWRSRLQALEQLLLEDPIDPRYEIFMIRDERFAVVPGGSESKDRRPWLFDLEGVSGAGVWLLPERVDKPGTGIFAPSKLRFVGVQQSFLKQPPASPQGQQWVRGSSAAAVLEILREHKDPKS